jgi:hypothetical protein
VNRKRGTACLKARSTHWADTSHQWFTWPMTQEEREVQAFLSARKPLGPIRYLEDLLVSPCQPCGPDEDARILALGENVRRWEVMVSRTPDTIRRRAPSIQ